MPEEEAWPVVPLDLEEVFEEGLRFRPTIARQSEAANLFDFRSDVFSPPVPRGAEEGDRAFVPAEVLANAAQYECNMSSCDCVDCMRGYCDEQVAYYRLCRRWSPALGESRETWYRNMVAAVVADREEMRRVLEAEEARAAERRRIANITCVRCRTVPSNERITVRGSSRVCDACLAHMVSCFECSIWVFPEGVINMERVPGRVVCRRCAINHYNTCRECGVFYDPNTQDQCCESAPCEECDSTDCSGDCFDVRSSSADIQDYSYRPRPIFHGKDDNGVFYGVELELAMKNDRYDLARRAYNHFGELVYIKGDSSISYGWEMVTHPMSATHALTEVPWADALADLESRSVHADSSTGMHVHVSKRGFSGPDHDYRWLMFWHRNSQPLTAMARRDPSQWGRFDDGTRQDAVRIAKKRGTSPTRYAAINSNPPQTYEVRVFASSVDPAEVTGSIALVAATVEYTRGLRAQDVLRRKGWEWETFIAWLGEPGRELYAPALAEWNRLKPTVRKRKPRTSAATSIF